jgi:hypothetical protein
MESCGVTNAGIIIIIINNVYYFGGLKYFTLASFKLSKERKKGGGKKNKAQNCGQGWAGFIPVKFLVPSLPCTEL